MKRYEVRRYKFEMLGYDGWLAHPTDLKRVSVMDYYFITWQQAMDQVNRWIQEDQPVTATTRFCRCTAPEFRYVEDNPFFEGRVECLNCRGRMPEPTEAGPEDRLDGKTVPWTGLRSRQPDPLAHRYREPEDDYRIREVGHKPNLNRSGLHWEDR